MCRREMTAPTRLRSTAKAPSVSGRVLVVDADGKPFAELGAAPAHMFIRLRPDSVELCRHGRSIHVPVQPPFMIGAREAS
jgi:hypothetical protein